MQCLGEALAATAARQRLETALLFEGVQYTYGLIDARAATVAEALRGRGVQPGDRVAVALLNSPELVVSVLGVLRLGAVLVPINAAAALDEVTYILEDSAAHAAILEPTHAAALLQADLHATTELMTAADTIHGSAGGVAGGGDTVTRVDPETAALIVYTSGTTGRPKGAALSHRALLSNLLTVAAAWQWTENDHLLLTLPCFHLHGLGLGILTSFLVGSSVTLRPRFQLDTVLADLVRSQATMFFGVPTIYNRLVGLDEDAIRAHDLKRMRLWVSGSAPLSVATYERFRERFGYSLMNRYGMTECGFALSTVYDEARRPGVVGRALPGVEVRIVDPERADQGAVVEVADGEQGEILIKGPNLFSGYWQRPDATRAAMIDGYLRSGDLAVREADGQIRIVGRSSIDIIKTRGFKVGAVEIEDCLQRHPAVQEVAVVGVPDADQGERVVAAITLKEGADASAEELRAHARQHLAPHKVPAQIVFLAEIPKTGPGKFKKKELAAKLCT